MVSIKIKFRPSTVADSEGAIYYQVIQNRTIRQLTTEYRIFSYEWNENKGSVIVSPKGRWEYLQSIDERIGCDIKILQSIIAKYETKRFKFTADDIVSAFREQAREQSLFCFMQGIIEQLQQMEKHRTSEAYRATLNSFIRFRNNKIVLLNEIDSDMMRAYEAYLHNRGVTRNSSSFYMRILRAVYNRAVEKELTIHRNPFKHVYTGVDKTIKRAISLDAISQIKRIEFSACSSFDLARDMFMFSFYTRGMSFIDMAYLKKKDLSNGILSYRRRKTGQQLFIRWEKCMQCIVDKYDNSLSEYLLPLINPMNGNERTQYINAMYLINRKLKVIGRMVGVKFPLTMYAARHSWASAAKDNDVPISVISKGMGHDSETTTQIYLSSLDMDVVDNANSMILDLL